MSGPGPLILDVGFGCGHRCVFCLTGESELDRSNWLPFELVKEEIAAHAVLGLKSLLLTGTVEPMEYPRLWETLSFARERGFEHFTLFTNGTGLADDAAIDRLAAAGVRRVGLSLHSPEAAVEDAMTRVPGSWRLKVAALDRLLAHEAFRAAGGSVAVSVVITPATAPRLSEHLRFLKSRGVESVELSFVWPRSTAPAAVPRFRDAVPHLVSALAANEAGLGLELGVGDLPPCVLRFGAVPGVPDPVAAYEKRYLAPKAKERPVLSTGGMRFDMQDFERSVLKTRTEACLVCARRDSCDGVWRTYAALYGTSELEPLAEAAPA